MTLEEQVKRLKKTIAKLEGEVRFQKKMRAEDKKNSDTKRVDFWGPRWQDAACQATSVGADKGIGTMAPVVDRKPKNVAGHAAVPLLVSTFDVQTDEQVVAEATIKPFYTLVATQVTLVPTVQRNETSGGPVPPAGGAEPQLVGA